MSNATAIRQAAVDAAALKNAASAAQVKRYWPGRAPDWYEETAADREEAEEAPEEDEEAAVTAVAAPVVLKKVADPRLARLSVKSEREVAAPQVVSRRRERDDESSGSELEGDAPRRKEELDSEEEEAVTARREAVRDRLKKQAAQQEQELLATAESEAEEEEEEEEESEYDTDSEDEVQFGRQMLKPVFVPKAERETIAEREALEREEEEAMKREKVKLAERALQTKELVVEQLRAEEAAARARREGPKELGDIDTDDEKDGDADYEQWRQREMRRIRRDREEREAQKEEEAEKERLRKMTPEQRAAWERENPKQVAVAPKKTWKFMQKYWHKGAYFQEASDNPHAAGQSADDIFMRDYSGPTGEDKLNREMLPQVMQVKNFGRRGRTKYTHLVDQDTSVLEDPLAPEGLRRPREPTRKLAGTDNVFEKPKKLNT